MQSNQLGATQLMSGFLAGTKGRIADKIKKDQFSQELAAQHDKLPQNNTQGVVVIGGSNPATDSAAKTLAPTSTATATATPTATATSATASGCTKATPSKNLSKVPAQEHNNIKNKTVPPKSPSASAIERQLFFSNPALLTSVINQLHLSASTRDACKAAEDDQGRISLKALYDILKKVDPAKPAPKDETGAASQEVQQLLASLTYIKPGTQPLSLPIKVKPKGTYNVEQFRQLLQDVVARIHAKESQPSASTTAAESAVTADPGNSGATNGDLQQTADFEQIRNPDRTPIPTALAEAVDQHAASRKTQPSGQSTSPAQPAPDHPQKSPQAAVQKQPDADKGKPVQAVFTNPAVSKSAPKSARPHTAEPPQNPPPTNDNAGSPDASPARTDSSVQVAKRTQPLTSQQPPAAAATKASLAQLSTADGTVLVNLQKSSPAGKSSGKPQQAAVSASPVTGLSGTSPEAEQITRPQSSGNSFSQQEKSKQDDSFSSASPPGDKTPGLQIGGFGQLTHNALQQATTFSTHGSPLQENPSLSLQDPSWPEKLAQQFQGLQNQGGTRLTLELTPKDLGHLTLHIETQQNQVHAFISADNEQAKNLLMQNAAALRTSLEQQGLMLGQMSVDVRRDNSGGQSANRQKSASRKTPKRVGGVKSSSRHAIPAQALYRSTPENQVINLFT